MAEPDTRVLSDTVVLSVGHTLPGLYCLAALRDLGAQVIRIERRARRDGTGPYDGVAENFPLRSLYAGTHELRLDLKHARGASTFSRLAKRAHVVLEGFRPGVARRLGIDGETLRESNDRLVYVTITGYGQGGPDAQRAGHDINYLAETGVLGLGNPIGVPGATFADGMAGLSAALNVVAAIRQADRTGKGETIDCAIVDAPLYLMVSELEYFWRTGRSRGAGDTHLSGGHPWYGIHTTADGRSLAVGAVEPRSYEQLCRGLGKPELVRRQFAAGAARSELRDQFAKTFAERSEEETLTMLKNHDACVSPVRSTAEVARSSLMTRVVRRDPATGEGLVRTPVRLPLGDLPTEKGSRKVLARFGFAASEIESLVRDGAVGDDG